MNNSVTQLTKKFFRRHFVLKQFTSVKKIVFFSSKINFNFFFQNLQHTPEPDPDLEPEPGPNSMYLDPQHWCELI